ncbi:MAG: hypothetical protein HYU64_12315 [Armatimonadetes bacterium]|nr:hypothetical protein [Armatimonadota bacterium]
MQGVRFGNYDVFLYATMLHTTSPLLKEIYCESHRYEPWALYGSPRRVGRYRFPNVLYVEANIREGMLADVWGQLFGKADFTDSLARRYEKSSLNHQRALVAAMRGDWTRKNIADLIAETCRILSCGIFKERFEYTEALGFLALFMPVRNLRDRVLALYQPLCIPHFLKFELKLLYFCERYAEKRDPSWITRCIAQCAYLSRFLIEETPYDDPSVMKREMEKVMDQWGSSPQIRDRRLWLLRHHRDAVREALLAERDILQHVDEFGSYSMRSKITVKNCLKFIQFIATFEELKHIYAVQTARVLNQIMKNKNLEVSETRIQDLLEALASPSVARWQDRS